MWNTHGSSSPSWMIFICFMSLSHTNSLFHTQSSVVRVKRQSSCSRLQFSCANGECIPSYNVCDGPKDCSDGSDENKSACRVANIRCPSLAFECAYGACIDKELNCNNVADCADGSDEDFCNSTTPTPPQGCVNNKFHCNNGQCIDQYGICDGAKDCEDGSDETKELCKNLKCPSSSFQCDYGACLERSVRCNGQSDCPDGSDELGCPGTVTSSTGRPIETPPYNVNTCTLPVHPEHGMYTSTFWSCTPNNQSDACRNVAGTPVPTTWVLKYSCDNGYNLTSYDNEYSICDNGIWKNSLDCIKLCTPLKSLSVNVQCYFQRQEVSCDQSMKPQTTATTRCKQHYRLSYNPGYSSLLCKDNGEWSYPLLHCTPECGVSSITATVTPLILHGSPTRQGEFPWLAALYIRKELSPWEQKCGGTLITPHIVLTAAHCLVSNEGLVRTENIKVGLGKYYRDYYTYENNSVIANVRKMVTPQYYTGLPSLFALDIGLIDLVESVQITAFIMPACVDWHYSITLHDGEVGHVAGWGTTENNTSSDTVLSTQLEYINNKECISRIQPVYRRFVTHDKFCAGSYNGSQVNKGDSGGGLTFVKDNGQHFVIGVVSTKIVNVTSFSLFTDISNGEHRTWLDKEKTDLEQYHTES